MTGSILAPQSPSRSLPCPHCQALPGDRCVTPSGRERHLHQVRIEAVQRRYRSWPSVVSIREDQPRLGLTAGEQYLAMMYWLDPQKVTLMGRLDDMHDPECNQYRSEVVWLRWATQAEADQLNARDLARSGQNAG